MVCRRYPDTPFLYCGYLLFYKYLDYFLTLAGYVESRVKFRSLNLDSLQVEIFHGTVIGVKDYGIYGRCIVREDY